MAKEVVLNFKLNGAEQSVKNISELKSAIQSLESELNNAKFGSAGFEKQKAQLDELKDKYSELSKTAGQKAKESAEKFQAAGDDFEKFSKGMVDAFTGVAIAIGASDEDTEKFMRTFVQFQGIATGVKGAIEGVLVVTKNWSAIQKVLNAVLFANPIGLIVLGVAALAGGIYLLIKNIDAVIEVFSDWKNIVLALLGPLGWILIAMNEISKQEEENSDARRKQAKQNLEDYKKELVAIEKNKEARIKAADETIDALELEKDTLEANGKMSDDVTIKILEAELEKTKAILDANNQRIQSAIDYYTKQAELSGLSTEDFKKQMLARGVDLDKWQEQANEVIKKNEMTVQYSENAITKFKREANEERVANAKEKADEENALRQAAYQAEMARLIALQAQENALMLEIEKAENDYYNSKLTARELDLQNSNDYYFGLIEQAKQYGIDTTILEEAQRAKIAEINEKYDKQEEDARKARQDKQKADFDSWKADEVKKEQEATARKIGIAEDYANSVNELASGIFALTNSFGKQDEASREKRAKRQFQIQKALNLSMAVVDGFKAITSSLAQSPIAIGPVPNPAGIASLAFAAASTAANIAKIAASQYKSSASGGSSSASASVGSSNIGAGGFGDVSSPTLNTQTLFSSGGGQTQTITPFGNKSAEAPIVKAYVVETDITSAQKNIFNIERRASLGIAG